MSDDATLRREEAFHDAWASDVDPGSVPVEASFALPSCPENRWIAERLGDVRGLTVLELGAGLGEASVWFARRGATVVATDLSGGMLRVAREVGRRHDTAIFPAQMDGATLAVSDASVDIVYGANVLHHVDTATALREVHRVLRSGGRAVFWDPVRYNPVINVYRGMADQVRSKDEHPLGREELALMRRTFAHVEVRFFWLASLLVFLWYFAGKRLHPNADRYWKRIVTHYDEIAVLHRPLAALDRVLTRIPGLRWWSWNMAVVCTRGTP